MDERLSVNPIKDGKVSGESCYLSDGATINYIEGTIEGSQSFLSFHPAVLKVTNQDVTEQDSCQFDSFLFKKESELILTFIDESEEFISTGKAINKYQASLTDN